MKIKTDLIGKRCAIVNRGDGTISATGVIRGIALSRKGSWSGKWLFLIQEDQARTYSTFDARTGKVDFCASSPLFRSLREVGSADEQWDVVLPTEETTP